jgi:hypothetical protein
VLIRIDPLLIFVGKYQNANNHLQFALITVLFYNEPRFENSFQEQLLLVFACDPISAQGKYKNVAQIVRTPVDVTCNDSPFVSHKRWSDRMFRYRLKSCSLLQDVHKRLNPMYFPHLLKHFDISVVNKVLCTIIPVFDMVFQIWTLMLHRQWWLAKISHSHSVPHDNRPAWSARTSPSYVRTARSRCLQPRYWRDESVRRYGHASNDRKTRTPFSSLDRNHPHPGELVLAVCTRGRCGRALPYFRPSFPIYEPYQGLLTVPDITAVPTCRDETYGIRLHESFTQQRIACWRCGNCCQKHFDITALINSLLNTWQACLRIVTSSWQ